MGIALAVLYLVVGLVAFDRSMREPGGGILLRLSE
jgi:hypothetical protein